MVLRDDPGRPTQRNSIRGHREGALGRKSRHVPREEGHKGRLLTRDERRKGVDVLTRSIGGQPASPSLILLPNRVERTSFLRAIARKLLLQRAESCRGCGRSVVWAA